MTPVALLANQNLDGAFSPTAFAMDPFDGRLDADTGTVSFL
jgi:hypothetical protein